MISRNAILSCQISTSQSIYLGSNWLDFCFVNICSRALRGDHTGSIFLDLL